MFSALSAVGRPHRFPRRIRKKLFLSRGGKTKARPKDRIIFETSCKSITRGTTQIAPLGRLSSDSAKPYALTQQSREGSTCRTGFLPSDSGATDTGIALPAFTCRRLSEKARALSSPSTSFRLDYSIMYISVCQPFFGNLCVPQSDIRAPRKRIKACFSGSFRLWSSEARF